MEPGLLFFDATILEPDKPINRFDRGSPLHDPPAKWHAVFSVRRARSASIFWIPPGDQRDNQSDDHTNDRVLPPMALGWLHLFKVHADSIRDKRVGEKNVPLSQAATSSPSAHRVVRRGNNRRRTAGITLRTPTCPRMLWTSRITWASVTPRSASSLAE